MKTAVVGWVKWAVSLAIWTYLSTEPPMPQPREWVFVGRTDNGPRAVFSWEIVQGWWN